MSEARIYHVRLKDPTDLEQTEYFFLSLAAIYDLFTPEQLGVSLSHLYNSGVTKGVPYDGRLCSIKSETAYRKAQKSPHKREEATE